MKQYRKLRQYRTQVARFVRQRLGLNDQAFSALIGVSHHTIFNWERGITTPRGITWTMLSILAVYGETAINWCETARNLALDPEDFVLPHEQELWEKCAEKQMKGKK